MDLESQAFAEAKDALRAAGLLDLQRLAVTPEASLPEIARLAVQGNESALTKEDMLEWLTAERYKAIPQHHTLQAEQMQYDDLHRYRLSLEEKKAKKDMVIHESHAKIQEVKMSRQAAPNWLGQISKLQRTDARDRKATDEADRTKWATISLNVLITAGWVPSVKDLGEAGWERMLLRLKKGLRVRTLEARARSLERIFRWAKIANNGNWPESTELLEDYMSDLSTRKGSGVSTFERARYAYLYAEAAVGKDKKARIGDSASLKATIKELTLKVAGKSEGKIKQAPQLLSSILVRLEMFVLTDTNPTYLRAYAWLKLVTFWGALRGDDSTWMIPSSVTWSEKAGLKAALHQTKTTGPAKKTRTREIHISPNAFFAQKDWIPVGLDLWKGADMKRENFIVLPSDDFQSFTHLSAIPADRAALTRQILHTAGLSDAGSDEFKGMKAIVSYFWTEHSLRATLVSMARALHVPKAITDRLGWWSVGAEASEGYIRSYRILISKVQEKVAKTIRDAWGVSNNPDVFGENYILEELKDRILKKKSQYPEKEIDAFIDNLRVFSNNLADPGDEESQEWWKGEAEKEKLAELIEDKCKDPDITKDNSSDEEPRVVPKTVPIPGTWVVTKSRRCLHVVGRCHRQPGVHYYNFVEVKPKVKEEHFSSACSVCFPLGWPLYSEEGPEVVDDELADGMPIEAAIEDGESSDSAS